MSRVGSLRGVQANFESCNSNSSCAAEHAVGRQRHLLCVPNVPWAVLETLQLDSVSHPPSLNPHPLLLSGWIVDADHL
jgi:hypothetical protein